MTERRLLRLMVGDGCHLCVDAIAVATQACDLTGADLEIVPIDGDPDLEAAYRTRLPVAEVDGREVGRYVLEPDLLLLALAR